MRRTLTAAILSLLAGCGGGTATPAVDAGAIDAPATPPPDAAIPDATPSLPPDARPSIGVGAACPAGNECAMGLFCLDDSVNLSLPPNGYCTRMCVTDDDCGGDAFCSPGSVGPPGSPRLCFQRCATDAASCAGAPERVCATSFGGVIPLGTLACVPGDATKTDGDPCAGYVGSCNANQACLANPFETPGGMCLTFGCTPGDDSTCAPGGDGVCVVAGTDTICFDRCSAQAECRQSEGYTCDSLPGVPTSVCWLHHSTVGSACVIDTDCGGAGSPWRCLTGPSFPAGYCSGTVGTCSSADETSCPSGSACYDPDLTVSGDQFCAALCSGDDDCRAADNYTCQSIGMGLMGCL